MGQPRKYATNAERQRAYRERHHVCRAESILPKRLDDALWAYAHGDDELYLTLLRAICAADPRLP